jgi:hypothetical protein
MHILIGLITAIATEGQKAIIKAVEHELMFKEEQPEKW